MGKLVIIDYNTISVDIYDIDNEANIDEAYISSLGHHPSECSWMFCEGALSINYHKEVLK